MTAVVGSTRAAGAAVESALIGRTFFRRNLACGQIAFGGFWTGRAILAGDVTGAALIVALSAVLVATVVVILGGLRRVGQVARPDFSHPTVRRSIRRLTWATVAQLLGSLALATLIARLGWDAWTLPSLVTTIGLFLVIAGIDLAVIITARLGGVMVVGSMLAPVALDASISPGVLAAGTAALLVASGLACFAAARDAAG